MNPMQPQGQTGDFFSFMANIPSSAYYFAMLGSVLASAALYIAGRRQTALFVGEWAPTLLTAGLFYKLLHPSAHRLEHRIGSSIESMTS